jgi:hypothetical protein
MPPCARPPLSSRGVVLASFAAIVIWFYQRRGEHLRCEIHEQAQGDKFALVVTLPDGTERTEYFDDSVALSERSLELEQAFREDGWDGPFARGI